nr:hypothetical protein DM860_014504 [Ipomoea trifida]GMC99225.1 hypothetical protein DM860_014504 [Ipomoea batatas]GMD00937.1 hypothetical protein DM860_014504 [Ipomoea batatas]
MNTSASAANKGMSAQGQMERKVETVDYESCAGHAQEQRPVEVTHQPVNKKTSGALLTNAAASVVSTLDSAKEALSNSKT